MAKLFDLFDWAHRRWRNRDEPAASKVVRIEVSSTTLSWLKRVYPPNVSSPLEYWDDTVRRVSMSFYGVPIDIDESLEFGEFNMVRQDGTRKRRPI